MDFTTPNTTSSSPNTLLEHNETLLTRDMLLTLLADLSMRILNIFQAPIRLVVHGGAAMLLHPGLYAQPGSRRRDTRDIDYIYRAFVEEWRQLGMSDAGERLQCCLDATAVKFNLGKDWMNAHADIALPMANDPQGRRYDPIYTSSVMPNNVHLHTLYTSPGLVLVSVTPFWAVALKLVRYQKHDPADITAILRNGTRLNGVQWSVEILESWLKTECWAMGYANYPDWLKRDMRERITHAVAQLNQDLGKPPPNSSHRLSIEVSPPEQHLPPHSHLHSMPFPPQSQNRPRSSLDIPSHKQHSTTFPEAPHRRLGRPSSMTFFPPPQNQFCGLLEPPPNQTRTHSMPHPVPMPTPQHSHSHSHSHCLSAQHPLSSSSQNPGMRSITPAPPPVGLLMPPPFHIPQPSPTVHHSHSHSHSQSHLRSRSQSHSHSSLMWPSAHHSVIPQPHHHGMNWAGQIFITA